MSRIRTAMPIFAFTRHAQTQRRVTAYRGVHTVPFDTSEMPSEVVNRKAIEVLVEGGYVEKGDLVIMTKGDFMNAQGGTNALKIVRIGDEIP